MKEHIDPEREDEATFASREPPKNERNEILAPTSQVVHDPVCHRDIAANEAASSLEYQGFAYYFCSDDCRSAFDRSPDGVIEAETAYTHREPAPPMTEVPRPSL